MKKASKLIATIMALSILFILASCNKKKPIDDTSSSSGVNIASQDISSDLTSDISSSTDSSTTSNISTSTPSGSTTSTVQPGTSTKFTLPNVTLKNKKVTYFVGEGDTLEKYRSSDKNFPTAIDLFEKNYGGQIELITTSWDNYYTTLLANYQSGVMPDLIWPLPDAFPTALSKDLAYRLDKAELKPYIDLNSEIWDETRYYTDLITVGDKNYFAVNSLGNPNVLVYNPKLFEMNDLEKPLDLYKRDPNAWNWDKLLEYAKALTVRTNGEVKQWGLAIAGNGSMSFSESTGVGILEFSSKAGLVNNLKNSAIADAANFIKDLGPSKYNVLDPTPSHLCNTQFILGKVAMVTDFTWRATADYKNLWKQGKIEVAPFPRYPKLSKKDVFYGGGQVFTFFIGSKAKNPEAAALMMTLGRYTSSALYDRDYKTVEKGYKYKEADRLGVPREQITMLNEIAKGSNNKFPYVTNFFFAFSGRGWSSGFEQLDSKSWSAIVEENYPSIQDESQKRYKDVVDYLK